MRIEGKGWRVAQRENDAKQCVPTEKGEMSDASAWKVRFRDKCAVCDDHIGAALFYRVPKEDRPDGWRGPQWVHAGCELT